MPISQKWKKTGSRPLASYRIFDIREDRYLLPRNGQEAPFYVLESPDWVNVIPLTEKEEVVLIRQFRFGLNETTVEIPGGIVDTGLTPLEAGRKELLEETGYASDHWEYLGFVHPNPAFLNNRCHTFLARNARKTAETALEESEEIEVVLFPFREVKDLIRGGFIRHSLVICAFYWLELKE
jgi:ADP-ribose pyrophosphatase